MGQFDKNKFDGVSNVWETPLEFFNPLNAEFGFTIDVAASADNKKVERYFDQDKNGLIQQWDNEIYWCNPPYGRVMPKWIQKAKDETKKGATTVLLILAKTNTKWFHDICMTASEIRFVKGRPKFVGAKDGLPFPLMLVVFKPNSCSCNISSYDFKTSSVLK